MNKSLILTFLMLSLFLQLIIPDYVINVYTFETPPDLYSDEYWLYNATTINKTSGEEYPGSEEIYVDDVTDEYYTIRHVSKGDSDEVTIYYKADRQWKIHSIFMYISGYNITYVYKGDELPQYWFFPSEIGEYTEIDTIADLYVDGEYYYSFREVIEVSVLRKENIIYREHVIPVYVVTSIVKLLDLDTGDLLDEYNTTYWINIDFKLPFIVIIDTGDYIVIEELTDFYVEGDPLSKYPKVKQNYTINFDFMIANSDEIYYPDTFIQVKLANGTSIAEINVYNLPASIDLEEGTYVFSISQTQGYTTDREHQFEFLYWLIDSAKYVGDSVSININSDTNVTLVFNIIMPTGGNFTLKITYTVTGSYSQGVPNTKINIRDQLGRILYSFNVNELPSTVILDRGTYVLEVSEPQGKTIDGKGVYRLKKWVVNGVEYTSNTLNIDLNTDTDVNIVFEVNYYNGSIIHKLVLYSSKKGNYTQSEPNAVIKVMRNSGELVKTVKVSELPVSIELEEGTYTLTIDPSRGQTIDSQGYFEFKSWCIDGLVYEAVTVNITLNEDKTVIIEFVVNSYPKQQVVGGIGQPSNNQVQQPGTGSSGIGSPVTPEAPTPWYTQPVNIALIAGLAGLGAALYVGWRKNKIPVIIGLVKGSSRRVLKKRHHITSTRQRSYTLARKPMQGTIHTTTSYHRERRVTVKRCPYCGALIPAKARYCPKCGKPQPLQEKVGKKICPNCGAVVPLKAKYCPRCGTKLS